uniref:Uncharacterized protein n=1 Tax=Cacopsylla melanoneura TaxID=428564 RepID=A0A8D9ANT1_9HEMI
MPKIWQIFSFSFFPWAVLRLGYSFHFPVRRLNGVRVNFSASVLKSTPRTRENCQFFLLMSLKERNNFYLKPKHHQWYWYPPNLNIYLFSRFLRFLIVRFKFGIIHIITYLCLQFVVFPIMSMVIVWNIVIQRMSMSNMFSSFYFLQPSYYFPSFVCNHK